MRVANHVLHKLGATDVRKVDSTPDPQTESDFLALDYSSPVPITWADYQAKYNEVLQARAMKDLRAERNRRIAKTDWIMTVDNAETLANKADWVAYRQALRDLPENPPAFVWDGPTLDFSKMNMPVEPPVIRIPPS
jgi:hypothetical protein